MKNVNTTFNNVNVTIIFSAFFQQFQHAFAAEIEGIEQTLL